jgi:hypothetical protein
MGGGSGFSRLVARTSWSSSTSVHFSTLRVSCSKLTPAALRYFLISDEIVSAVFSVCFTSAAAN